MGRPTKQLAYDPATDTLSGRTVHNQRVDVYVDGEFDPSRSAQSSAADGGFSLVLGLAQGAHTVRVGLNRTSLSAPLKVTKP